LKERYSGNATDLFGPGHPFTAQNPLAGFGLLLICLFSVWGIVIPASTQSTANGVRQLSACGWFSSTWPDIRKIKAHRYGYHLYGNGHKYIVTPIIYSNGNEKEGWLQDRVSAEKWEYST
jgi:hypothetical protein